MAGDETADGSDWEPEFAPWDGRRVPVTLLGGYLGAGKTTVLNALLAAAVHPIAVLVNDVGEINIDAALVARRHGDTIELTDGCVCCTLTRGLADAFDDLRARPEPPAHVVVELSGVADPRRVAPWASSTGFMLDGVVVLADAEQLPTLAADPSLEATVTAQLEAADLVVLTKTDRASAAQVDAAARTVTTMVPNAPIADPGGPDAAASLLRLGGRRPGGATDVPPSTLFDPHTTHVVALPDPIDRPGLERLLDGLPVTTVRAKGVAAGPDGQRLLVQVVGDRRSIEPLPPAEAQDPTDLVVITVPGLRTRAVTRDG